jgi:hypothetical protein
MLQAGHFMRGPYIIEGGTKQATQRVSKDRPAIGVV